MENPLLELQEYDNLVQALKSGKGPQQGNRDPGFAEGTS